MSTILATVGLDQRSYSTLGPVSACGWPSLDGYATLAQNQAPRPTQPEPAVCGRLDWVPGKSWESKQAHRMIH